MGNAQYVCAAYTKCEMCMHGKRYLSQNLIFCEIMLMQESERESLGVCKKWKGGWLVL